jgi:methionine-rich copper-binding protein CopC
MPCMRRRTRVPAVARRGLALIIATGLATLGLLAIGTSVAQAHDELLGSTPQAGAALEAAPDRIELQFSGDVQELGTEVLVTADDGTAVSDGPVQVDGTTVVQPLSADLSAGSYVVDWRVTSADGHPLSDRFSFTVAGGTSDGAAASSSATTTAIGEAAAATTTEASSNGVWIAVAAAAVLLVAAVVAVRQLRRRP